MISPVLIGGFVVEMYRALLYMPRIGKKIKEWVFRAKSVFPRPPLKFKVYQVQTPKKVYARVKKSLKNIFCGTPYTRVTHDKYFVKKTIYTSISWYTNRGLKELKSVEIFEKCWKITNCATKTLEFGPNCDCSHFSVFYGITRSFFSILQNFHLIWVSCWNTKKMRYNFQCIKRIIYVASHFTKKRLKQKCLRIVNILGIADIVDIRQLCFCGHFIVHIYIYLVSIYRSIT